MTNPCISAKRQAALGVGALDIAKMLIDEGFHPPTVYFPLIVKEALAMIKPTETESKETMDWFIDAMKTIARKAQETVAMFDGAPRTTPWAASMKSRPRGTWIARRRFILNLIVVSDD